ncbi:TerD family protein [Streptomyces sp. NPDC050504]|uniref:TerD family protein n=1 Tax=Streptomyces sp. NPDC050504 TaxID=3365618 RepID=UPI00379A1320
MSLVSAAVGLPDMREYAHEWALVDVETSGLVARRDRVLSVAVVTLGADGEQTGEFSTLLDPGCDPGPVEVHGLTAERLRGAPGFGAVAGRIAALLEGRVLVAHNAQFDYDFLAHEFARARTPLPVTRRLCTLALNRQMDPPTEDLKLGTLAAHYGVPQTRAHDALDDTRVLTGILRASLREAARLGLPLPFVSCPPRQDVRFAPRAPKTPCPYRNPGRMAPGGPLLQGMKVAVTGSTDLSRADLVERAVAAGLNVVSSVSRHTSVLVTNEPASTSAKARRAAAEGVPVLDEAAFLRLLAEVGGGERHGESGGASVGEGVGEGGPESRGASGPKSGREGSGGLPAPRGPLDQAPVPAQVQTPAPAPASAPARTSPADRPLHRRRVLVLGGTHPVAVAARTRVVELGGSAAVNLSASVTDVVLLADGERDRRMRRITALEIPVHDTDWLDAPTPVAPTAWAAVARASEPQVLPRGGVVDLPPGQWHVTAGWVPPVGCEIDVVAFALDGDEQVPFDEDFVFYGAPENPSGTVRLLTDGPAEQTVVVDLPSLAPSVRKLVVAAAVDGPATFGDVGAVQVAAAPGTGSAPLARATLDAATTERTLLLGELYRRGPLWRFRAVGQGYDHGLADLARGYGVDIAE